MRSLKYGILTKQCERSRGESVGRWLAGDWIEDLERPIEGVYACNFRCCVCTSRVRMKDDWIKSKWR